MARRWLGPAFVAMALLTIAPANAVLPDEVLDDPALEQRARDLSAELRCVVCQNQSIDDSDAELARELRILVRERIVAGDSDGEILDYLVARYGDFVLLKPRFNSSTALLWAAPAIVLIGGGVLAVAVLRRRSTAPGAASLTSEEEARLQRVLAKDSGEAG